MVSEAAKATGVVRPPHEPGAPETVPGGQLAPWTVNQLPEPPRAGWKLWIGFLGPGVVLAGTSIGTGEWLFGPAVSAQYGATLLWLASVSILLQVFCNLMMMRYAVYCGESIIVGGLRTWPGPYLWVPVYAVLDIASIWPYNASNAAVPLAAAVLGHLPAAADAWLVKSLGYGIFLLSFAPLIFGGTVYRMLEKIMSIKLVFVLGYLTAVVLFMVSGRVAWEVATGFFRFGELPLRADTVVVNRHFTIAERSAGRDLVVKGTFEGSEAMLAEFRVAGQGKPILFRPGMPVPEDLASARDKLVARARVLSAPGEFHVERLENGTTLTVAGAIVGAGSWKATQWQIADAAGTRSFSSLDEVPQPARSRMAELIANQGIEKVGVLSYVWEHGRLPDLDWAMIAAFAAIAGAGGLTNTLFSNYARDKGWGMGIHVGAIPSAIGGRTIPLSHVGEVFHVNAGSLSRWRGWIRHIVRDQAAVWMLCSFLGMALPCMLSLEFIRNATVEGNRVAAMTAEGMADRYPDQARFFWTMTLLCGFLILAPGQVSAGDQVARRWTDIFWTSSRWAKRMAVTQVRVVYYGILAAYAVWGLFALSWFNPLQIAKIGAVLQNIALGFSALHAWYVNQTLLPRELRPNLFLQMGVVLCGLFFLGISVVVIQSL